MAEQKKKKIIEGYWDCSFCGSTGISGLKRECPGCGKPRGENVKFYLKDEKNYLDEEQSKKVGAGPDWYCEYCGSLNSSSLTVCSSCGAEREDDGKTYEDVKNADAQREEKRKAEVQAYEAASAPKKKSGPVRYILLAVLALIIGFIVYSMIPKKDQLEVKGFSWKYNINIEEERLVEESDWDLPEDYVEILDTKEEVHHYEDVLDHYETVTVTVDAGNGTFEEEEHEEPVYRQDPVYETKYYYSLYKWFDSRDVETSGEDHEPYWGEENLAENERESSREETYWITAQNKKDKEQTYKLSKEDWEGLEIGDKIDVEVLGGTATITNK